MNGPADCTNLLSPTTLEESPGAGNCSLHSKFVTTPEVPQ